MAYTVEQCRKVVRIQDKIDILKSMVDHFKDDKIDRILTKSIKIIEEEKEKLLFKKI